MPGGWFLAGLAALAGWKRAVGAAVKGYAVGILVAVGLIVAFFVLCSLLIAIRKCTGWW